MGLFRQLIGLESSKRFETISANTSLFEELKNELPEEPLIQLQPRKDNPGLEHGPELVRSLWHYRQDAYRRNCSPVNSFEIWFDEGEIRFYFHPDTQEQKNSARKHFEDKFPGTRMEEEPNPFPQINKDDAIAGAQMTLRNNFVRPLRVPEGPKASSYSRDPFGSLTSDMVAENERTSDGERVEPEDIRMVVQVMFQPVSRSWSQGGLFGTDLNNYANELKQPKTKSGYDQTLRMIFGLEPKERKPTAKMKKTAKMISELRGEPGFLFRLRIISISPYEEMAKQHTERVCEAFEMYDNPVTEQSLEILPRKGDGLREMLKKMASREMHVSTIAKLLSGKDLISVPELAGMVHLPNETIQSPEVNWTTMEKGAGVPTQTPDLEDIDDTIREKQEQLQGQQQDGADNPPTPTADSDPQTSQTDRWQDVDRQTLTESDDSFDLRIGNTEEPEIPGHQDESEITADGQGLETDRLLHDDGQPATQDHTETAPQDRTSGSGDTDPDPDPDSDATDEQAVDVSSFCTGGSFLTGPQNTDEETPDSTATADTDTQRQAEEDRSSGEQTEPDHLTGADPILEELADESEQNTNEQTKHQQGPEGQQTESPHEQRGVHGEGDTSERRRPDSTMTGSAESDGSPEPADSQTEHSSEDDTQVDTIGFGAFDAESPAEVSIHTDQSPDPVPTNDSEPIPTDDSDPVPTDDSDPVPGDSAGDENSSFDIGGGDWLDTDESQGGTTEDATEAGSQRADTPESEPSHGDTSKDATTNQSESGDEDDTDSDTNNGVVGAQTQDDLPNGILDSLE